MVLLFLFSLVQNAFSQPMLKELKIGDKVPDVPLTMLNHPKQNIMLSEFKGKAILLDFWATWCSPCVAAFPKMDSLQQKFKGRLQVLPVTYQDKSLINLLFTKMNANSSRPLVLPATVINDRQLTKLFPHNSLPHYVWIGSDGIVKAITDMNQVTEDNIQSLLITNAFTLPEKIDEKVQVNYRKPVFVGDTQISLRSDEILHKNDTPYQSVLTGYRPEIQPAGYYDSNRVISANSTMLQLFQDALGERKPEFLSPNRVILKVKDSSLITYTGDEQDLDSFKRWQANNVYCYEIIVPVTYDKSSTLALGYMQNELNNYFGKMGISAQREIVKIKCYVLRKIPSSMPLTTRGGQASVQKNAFYYKLTNKKITTLLNDLRTYYWQTSTIPLKDETGITEPIDIEINAEMSNIEDVGTDLKKYGLVLSEELRDIDMIVITQR